MTLSVACLCPTYRRRRLLENAVACFLAQSHPAEKRRLLICDDSGESLPQRGDGWELLPVTKGFESLPQKYNFLAHEAIARWNPDVLAVFEDDDVYMADYVANHAKAIEMQPGGWSHCSWCWTDGSGGSDGGALRREETGHARLHGCLAISQEMFNRVGGWPETKRMDFDLQMLSRLRQECEPVDPCRFGTSQYFFRWASTGRPHGQGFCTGPDDENWMPKAQAAMRAILGPAAALPCLRPQMDSETVACYAGSR